MGVPWSFVAKNMELLAQYGQPGTIHPKITARFTACVSCLVLLISTMS